MRGPTHLPAKPISLGSQQHPAQGRPRPAPAPSAQEPGSLIPSLVSPLTHTPSGPNQARTPLLSVVPCDRPSREKPPLHPVLDSVLRETASAGLGGAAGLGPPVPSHVIRHAGTLGTSPGQPAWRGGPFSPRQKYGRQRGLPTPPHPVEGRVCLAGVSTCRRAGDPADKPTASPFPRLTSASGVGGSVGASCTPEAETGTNPLNSGQAAQAGTERGQSRDSSGISRGRGPAHQDLPLLGRPCKEDKN